MKQDTKPTQTVTISHETALILRVMSSMGLGGDQTQIIEAILRDVANPSASATERLRGARVVLGAILSLDPQDAHDLFVHLNPLVPLTHDDFTNTIITAHNRLIETFTESLRDNIARTQDKSNDNQDLHLHDPVESGGARRPA